MSDGRRLRRRVVGVGRRLAGLASTLMAVAGFALITAPCAGAWTGSLESIERSPDLAWSGSNITARFGGLSTITSDPMPFRDPATGQLCVAATISNPAERVAEFCRLSSESWLQFDLSASGPAAVGDVKEVIDPQSGQTDLFFRDPGGAMWALSRSASGAWSKFDVTASASGLSTITSDPMPFRDPATGQLCVAATAANPAGHVVEFCRQSNGGWLQFDVSAGGPAAVGDVEEVTDPQSGQTDLFFRDPGGAMWALSRSASGAWSQFDVTASASGLSTITSDPMPFRDPATGQLCVAATAANPAGHVVEFCRQSSGGWLQFDVSAGAPAAVGDPEEVTDPQSDQSDLFFRDPSGDLWSLDRNGAGGWSPDELSAAGTGPALISDPEPIVDPQTDDPLVLAAVSPLPPPPHAGSSPTTTTLTTPAPRAPRAIHARFVIAWHFDHRGTLIRWIRVRGMPRGARVKVRCYGPRCPRLRGSAVGRKRVARLLKSLGGRRLHPGDRLMITVTAAGRLAERIELRIRRKRRPVARLLA